MTSEIRRIKDLRKKFGNAYNKDGVTLTDALKVSQANRYNLFAKKGLLKVQTETSKNKYLPNKKV